MAARCVSCGTENDLAALFCRQCGQRLSVPETDPLIGEMVAGRYRVLRSLDEGGMSRVYVADQQLGRGSRDVALKVLKTDPLSDPGLGERFAREVELLGQLQHPNIVRIFDYGELADGQPFMVMELVAGSPLSDVVATEAPLEPQRVEQIAIQIASALSEAHERGIVHRDLKPHNVMLGSAGPQKDFVKVLDFGIARRVRGHELDRDITMKGTILGTPPYMAPEQFEGRTLDARTDIYALGVMLYELYTGALPFDAKSPMGWATKHLTEAPTPFEEHESGGAIPEWSRRAVMRTLSKSPDDRPQNVIELIRELTARHHDDSGLVLTQSGRLEVAPSSRPPAPRATDEVEAPVVIPGRTRLPLVMALGTLLLGLVVVAGAIYVWSGDAEDVAEVARVDAATPRTESDAAAGGPVEPSRPRHGFQSVHHVANASDAQNALGPADGLGAELRSRGILTLEIARDAAFEGDGSPEHDLFVTALEGSGPFSVEISTDHHQFEMVLRRSEASAGIDLDGASAVRPRYVRLRTLTSTPALIDAVETEGLVESSRAPAQ